MPVKPSADDLTFGDFYLHFKRAVARRKWSMISERIVPRLMPPLLFGTAFATQGWREGLLASGLTSVFTLISTRHAGLPFVREADAMRAIDRDIGGGVHSPARAFAENEYVGGSSALIKVHKDQIREQWGDQLLNQPFQTGLAQYYGGAHAWLLPKQMAYAASIVFTYAALHDHAFDLYTKLTTPSPLVYEASIIPPLSVESAPTFMDLAIKDAIKEGTPLTPHEGSRLQFVFYGRAPKDVLINDHQGYDIMDVENVTQGERETHTYTFNLPVDAHIIAMDDIELRLTVTPDNVPIVDIQDVTESPQYPGALGVEYTVKDESPPTETIFELNIIGPDGKSPLKVPDSLKLPQLIVPGGG